MLINLTINDLEKKFSKAMENVEVISDIEYISEEIALITSYLNGRANEQELSSGVERYPVSVAVFLVDQGINHYKEGNFWSSVYRTIGLPEEDTKWQRILGSAFTKTLDRYNLARFEVSKLKFVGPILAHGKIPKFYLDKFFIDFLLPNFKKVVSEPISLEEVTQQLKFWREDHQGREKLKAEISETEDKLRKVSEEYLLFSKVSEKWGTLSGLQKISEEIKDSEEINYLLKYPEDYYETILRRLEQLQELLSTLKDRGYDCRELVYFYITQCSRVDFFSSRRQAMKQKVDRLSNHLQVLARDFLSEEWQQQYEEDLMRLSVSYPRDRKSETNEIKKIGRLKRLLLILLRFIFSEKRVQQAAPVPAFSPEDTALPLKCSPYEVNYDIYESIKLAQGVLAELQETSLDLEREEKLMASIEYLPELAATCENIESYYESLLSIIRAEEKTIARYEAIITRVVKRLRTVQKKRDHLEGLLKAVGRGSIQAGREELEQQRKVRARQEELKLTLQSDINLEDLLSVFSQFTEKEKLETTIEGLLTRKNIIKDLLDEKKNRLESYPNPPFYPLPESTAVFLLSGVDSAVKFTYEALQDVYSIAVSDGNETDLNNDLPPDIVQGVLDFLSNMEKEDDAYRAETGIRWTVSGLRKPEFIFDVIQKEFRIKLNRLRFPLEDRNLEEYVTLELYGEEKKLIREPLETHLIDNEIEVEEVSFPILFPAREYTLTLIYSQETLNSWRIQGIDDYQVFDADGTQTNCVPNKAGWIVSKSSFRVDPESCVMERDRLIKEWKDYCFWNINFEETDYVCLMEGANLKQTLTKKEDFPATLVGGGLISSFTSSLQPVYIEELPYLLFSIDDPSKLRLWSLTISRFSGTEDLLEKSLFSLEDLVEENLYNGLVNLSLRNILNKAYGIYSLELSNRGRKRRSFSLSFAFMPSVEVLFDKEFIPPAIENEDCENHLILSSNTPYTFYPDPPNGVDSGSGRETSSCKVLFPFSERMVTGKISFIIDGENLTFPLEITVPTIRYSFLFESSNRLNDIPQWHFQHHEFWHEDIMKAQTTNLIVYCPLALGRRTALVLNNSDEQVLGKRNNDDTFSFRLQSFSDSLKESDMAVHSFSLSFLDRKDLSPVGLFQLRTRWEVTNLVVHQDLQDAGRILNLKWEQKGKPVHQPLIRFWHVTGRNEENLIRELEIVEGIPSTKFFASYHDFPEGHYLVHFAEVNPWGAVETSKPLELDQNVFKIKLTSSRQAIIDKILEYGLRLKLVEDRQKRESIELTEPTHLIKDIKVETCDLGSDETSFLIGTGYVIYQWGNRIKKMETSPVSFYYNLNHQYMAYITDIDGEGVIYCPECKELFWTVDCRRRAHRKFHIDPYDPNRLLAELNLEP